MESLQKVGVDLPEPQGIEIPSGGSPLAEAAQKGTGPLLTRPQQAEMTPVLKERVDFNKEEELPMWKAALMTATNQWLSAPVGMGLTPGEPSEPEELEAMSTSRLGFSMLAKGMAKRVGDMHSGEGIGEYMKWAVATTTPIINSYVSWKSLIAEESHKVVRPTKTRGSRGRGSRRREGFTGLYGW